MLRKLVQKNEAWYRFHAASYACCCDTVIEIMLVEGAAPESMEEWQVGYRMMALGVENMDKVLKYLKTKGIEAS